MAKQGQVEKDRRWIIGREITVNFYDSPHGCTYTIVGFVNGQVNAYKAVDELGRRYGFSHRDINHKNTVFHPVEEE